MQSSQVSSETPTPVLQWLRIFRLSMLEDLEKVLQPSTGTTCWCGTENDEHRPDCRVNNFMGLLRGEINEVDKLLEQRKNADATERPKNQRNETKA